MCTNRYIGRSTGEYTYIYAHLQIYIYAKHAYIYTHTNIHIDKYMHIYIHTIYIQNIQNMTKHNIRGNAHA